MDTPYYYFVWLVRVAMYVQYSREQEIFYYYIIFALFFFFPLFPPPIHHAQPHPLTHIFPLNRMHATPIN